MRAVLLLPFPFNVMAALLIVPAMLICGASEEALRRADGRGREVGK